MVPDYSADPYGSLKKVVPMVGLDPSDVVKLAFDKGFLFHQQEIWPEDFLDRAEADLEVGGDSAVLNAISNAKRAIHCQIDTALSAAGYEPAKWTMQRKLQRVASLGFVAPHILKRVADTRNVLEHEYRRPDIEQVREAVDLAMLFVGMAGQSLRSLGGKFTIGNFADYRQQQTGMFSRSLIFDVNTYHHTVTIRAAGVVLPEYNGHSENVTLAILAVGQPLYDASIRLGTARHWGRPLQLAAGAFLDELSLCP